MEITIIGILILILLACIYYIYELKMQNATLEDKLSVQYQRIALLQSANHQMSDMLNTIMKAYSYMDIGGNSETESNMQEVENIDG